MVACHPSGRHSTTASPLLCITKCFRDSVQPCINSSASAQLYQRDWCICFMLCSTASVLLQELSKLNLHELTPLTPEVISRQATINIGAYAVSGSSPHSLGVTEGLGKQCTLHAGTIGHVAHGKSTVVKAISGVQTVRFKNELERNITIKLGYANAKIYRARDTRVPRYGRATARSCSSWRVRWTAACT